MSPADFERSRGHPRPVTAPRSALTAYRTAQEALTNARKHAPGQPGRLVLTFIADEIDGAGRQPAAAASGRPAGRVGTGYGLTGLRERAVLRGGTLTAGPDDGEWRVSLRIPA